MIFDDIMAEIERLTHELDERPIDWHELYLALRGKLSEVRAMGMALPNDLVRFERGRTRGGFGADRKRRSPAKRAAPQPR